MKKRWAALAIAMFVPSLSVAQSLPTPAVVQGMHHLDVTGHEAKPPAAGKTETAPVPASAASATSSLTPSPAAKALKPEDALKKTDDLNAWPYMTDVMEITGDKKLDDITRQIATDPGSVPPRGLLFVAKALSRRPDRLEDAAFYYYAAQLRASFDMDRFPPYSLAATAKKKKDKRTEDQRGDTPDAPDVLIDPHEPDTVLALSVAPPISKYALQHPARLDAVMARVRDWDLATPYAYLPDYDISHAVPFEKWPQLLARTRNDYFTRARQISDGLKEMHNTPPARSFGDR